MSKPTRAAMITAAVRWLAAGLLPSALPARLMAEFGLTSDQARRLTEAALREQKRKTDDKSD